MLPFYAYKAISPEIYKIGISLFERLDIACFFAVYAVPVHHVAFLSCLYHDWELCESSAVLQPGVQVLVNLSTVKQL
jgi:hypothetical protein